jgi:hypothetical protein
MVEGTENADPYQKKPMNIGYGAATTINDQ